MENRLAVILIGFKGSGKSTVGKILADLLGGAFTDTDGLIEELFEQETGKTVSFRDIYAEYGRSYFVELEKKAVAKALAGDYSVISLGGGTLENLEDKIDLSQTVVVRLDVEKEELYNRIIKDGVPAFFDPEDSRGSFETFYERRAPRYNLVAEVTIDNTDKTPEETAALIVEHLETRA